MNFGVLAAKNAFRNKTRTALTAAGVAVAILAFLVMRTILWGWTVAAEVAAKDRVVTRNKITFIMPLPKKYFEQVKQVPGIKQATFASWFGGKDPKHEHEFFGTLAMDAPTALSVYDEMVVPEDQKAAWLANRQGAIVGDVLAKKLGWKVGDRVNLESGIFEGKWEFVVSGIYTTTRKSLDRSTFMFHWNYFNDSLPADSPSKDSIGWVVTRVDDPSKTADIATQIDRVFEVQDVQTMSQSERAFNLSFMGMMSAVLKAVDVVSIVILAIMLLILGNTIAMGVRERTKEYGTLRAIGFLPKHVAVFILGEALVTGLVGGLVGLAISIPAVNGLGKLIEENAGAIFPYFSVQTSTAGIALLIAVVLGGISAAIPAYQASRLKIVDSLRRVG